MTPWILTVRNAIDIEPYLARKPSYLQIELEDFGRYSVDIPTILSLHSGKLTSLEPIDELMSYPADLYKVAAYIDDPVFLMRFLKRVEADPKLIGIAMGESGEVTRALSTRLGNPLTFIGSAAPGQLNEKVLKERFRIDRQTRQTKAIGLLGSPLHLSPGTRLHNRAFEKLDLDWCYVNIPARENLATILNEAPAFFTGFSVTMPLKKEARAFAIDQSLPAVNTLARRGSTWVGINTDGPAAVECLDKHCNVDSAKIAILGTGGTALAISHAMRGKVDCIARKELPTFDPEPYDIIVQATSCGMEGHEMPLRTIPKEKLVLEAILRETPFSRACRANKCKVIEGMELFEAQARLQREFWQCP
jgi:shikimate dehydrogenase